MLDFILGLLLDCLLVAGIVLATMAFLGYEEFSETVGLKKDLLDYSENFIANFLLQYIGD